MAAVATPTRQRKQKRKTPSSEATRYEVPSRSSFKPCCLLGKFPWPRVLRRSTAVAPAFRQSRRVGSLSVNAVLSFSSIGLLIISPTSGWARDIFVPGPAELRAALLNAQAGDTLPLTSPRLISASYRHSRFPRSSRSGLARANRVHCAQAY